MGDDNDRELLFSLAQELISRQAQESPFNFFGKFSPPTSTLQDLKEYINTISERDTGEMFGFTRSQEEAYQEKKSTEQLTKCAELLRTKPTGSNEGVKAAQRILDSIPETIQVEDKEELTLFE